MPSQRKIQSSFFITCSQLFTTSKHRNMIKQICGTLAAWTPKTAQCMKIAQAGAEWQLLSSLSAGCAATQSHENVMHDGIFYQSVVLVSKHQVGWQILQQTERPTYPLTQKVFWRYWRFDFCKSELRHTSVLNGSSSARPIIQFKTGHDRNTRWDITKTWKCQLHPVH